MSKFETKKRLDRFNKLGKKTSQIVTIDIESVWKMGKLYKWTKEEILQIFEDILEKAYDEYDRFIEYPHVIDMGDYWIEIEKDS